MAADDKDEKESNVVPLGNNAVPVDPKFTNVVLLLNIDSVVFLPTMNLREVVPPIGLPYVQQLWQDPTTRQGEWRNLTKVYGTFPDRSPV